MLFSMFLKYFIEALKKSSINKINVELLIYGIIFVVTLVFGKQKQFIYCFGKTASKLQQWKIKMLFINLFLFGALAKRKFCCLFHIQL